MRPARQPAQDVFRTDNGERKALHRAIERGRDHHAARLHHLAAAAHEQIDIGDMLDDFHGQHDVEALAGIGQSLGGRRTIIDRQLGLLRVLARDLDIRVRRIGADHRGAKPRQRLRKDAAAATDIEDAQPRQAIEPAWDRGQNATPPDRRYSRAAPD